MLGFIFTIVWDIKKANDNDNVILFAIKEEINENLNILEQNKKLIQTELSVIEINKSLVTPLSLLKCGFWDFVKLNLPKKLNKPDLITKFRNLGQFVDNINENIRSRENYRIHNGAMSNYSSQLKMYDETIMDYIDMTIVLLKELQKDF